MSGLSKSRYVMFRQCEKSLWLEANKPQEAVVDQDRRNRLENGNDAMSIFPKIKDMNPTEAQAAREALLRYCKLDSFAITYTSPPSP